jgi:hypothetical protein
VEPNPLLEKVEQKAPNESLQVKRLQAKRLNPLHKGFKK